MRSPTLPLGLCSYRVDFSRGGGGGIIERGGDFVSTGNKHIARFDDVGNRQSRCLPMQERPVGADVEQFIAAVNEPDFKMARRHIK